MEIEKVVRVGEISRFLDEGLSIVIYKPIDIKDRYHLNL